MIKLGEDYYLYGGSETHIEVLSFETYLKMEKRKTIYGDNVYILTLSDFLHIKKCELKFTQKSIEELCEQISQAEPFGRAFKYNLPIYNISEISYIRGYMITDFIVRLEFVINDIVHYINIREENYTDVIEKIIYLYMI